MQASLTNVLSYPPSGALRQSRQLNETLLAQVLTRSLFLHLRLTLIGVYEGPVRGRLCHLWPFPVDNNIHSKQGADFSPSKCESLGITVAGIEEAMCGISVTMTARCSGSAPRDREPSFQPLFCVGTCRGGLGRTEFVQDFENLLGSPWDRVCSFSAGTALLPLPGPRPPPFLVWMMQWPLLPSTYTASPEIFWKSKPEYYHQSTASLSC